MAKRLTVKKVPVKEPVSSESKGVTRQARRMQKMGKTISRTYKGAAQKNERVSSRKRKDDANS